MPYSGPDDKSLPANVKKMTGAQRKRWVNVFNSAMEEHHDEGMAFRMANGVLKKNKKEVVQVGEKGYLSSWDAELRQISQTDADYNPLGATGAKGCANCNWFVSPNTCVLVRGDVSPTGISKFYQPIPVYEQEPLRVVVVGEEVKEKSFDTDESKSKSAGSLSAFKAIFNRFFGKKADETGGRAFQLYYDKDGNLRWFSPFTNNFIDSHTEIICDDAHKEYVEWVNSEKGVYPELHYWHCGEKSRFGAADFIDYVDGFVVASGPIDDGKEDFAYAVEKSDPGVSHGFIGVTNKDKVWTVYRTFEISPLPQDAASNKTLNVLYNEEYLMPFNEQKKAVLKELGLDDATISNWESGIKQQRDALTAQGIQFKSELDDGGAEGGEAGKEGQAAATSAKSVEQNGSGEGEGQFATKSELMFMAKAAAENAVTLGDISTAILQIATGFKALNERVDKVSAPIEQQVEQAYLAAVAKNPGGFVATASKDNAVNGNGNGTGAGAGAGGAVVVADTEFFNNLFSNIEQTLGVK